MQRTSEMDFLDLQRFSDISYLTCIATIIVFSLGIIYYLLTSKHHPPGPWGLPYFGYWPFLNEDTPHLQFTDMIKRYGDVYSFTVLGQLYIHLGSIKSIKEAHLTKGDCFAKRYSEFNPLNSVMSEGVAVANGESWKAQRKFYNQTFRELGLSSMKEYMTGPIYDCIMSTIENLKAEGGKPVNIITILTLQCTAIFQRIVFNDDGVTGEEIKELLEAYGKVINIFLGTNVLISGEFARRFILPLISSYQIAMENHKVMVAVLKKIVDRHEAAFDEKNVKNLIDIYIKERNERRQKNDPSAEYFTETALISSLLQFVGDGIMSVALFIGNFIVALMEHPEEQEKIFRELEDIIGSDRQPTLNDKNKLPYTNAFLLEVLRTMELITIFPSLQCTKETTVGGYVIPKGAITLMNVWANHRDPNTFEDPNEFKPSRYLTEPGKEKAELPVVFGVGKRSCIGESFTMMETFLFVTNIIKNFRLTSSEKFDMMALIKGNLMICAEPRK